MSDNTANMSGRRVHLIERDGGRCVWCSRKITDSNYSADHIITQFEGGSWAQENLVLACKHCNSRRGHTDPLVFARQCTDAGQKVRVKVLAQAISRSALPICTKEGARRRDAECVRRADLRRVDRLLNTIIADFQAEQRRAAGVLPAKERRRIMTRFHRQLRKLPTAAEPVIKWP